MTRAVTSRDAVSQMLAAACEEEEFHISLLTENLQALRGQTAQQEQALAERTDRLAVLRSALAKDDPA